MQQIKQHKWFIFGLLTILCIRIFLFFPIVITGQSMEPSYHNKQIALGSKHSALERFDIVTFHPGGDPDEVYIKRIIGMPGETIQYKKNKLYINNQLMEEPYKTSDFTYTEDFSLNSLQATDGITTIPKDSYFVLGDNRENSEDSRYIGFVNEKDIVGEVMTH